MEEEEKVTEISEKLPDEVKSSTNRDAYIDYMRSSMGDSFEDDDEAVFKEMMSYRKSNEDSKQRLADALGSDPRLAQVLADISNGKRGAADALVRYFGKDILNAEEGTDEWNSIEEAERERLSELEDMKRNKEEYDTNIDASIPVMEDFAKEKGIDIDDFLNETYSTLIEPIFKGLYTKELLDKLYNALHYESDIEDSFNSGVVAGRNQKIDKMRKDNTGDGMPRMGASSGVSQKHSRKKPTHRMSVWDD